MKNCPGGCKVGQISSRGNLHSTRFLTVQFTKMANECDLCKCNIHIHVQIFGEYVYKT